MLENLEKTELIELIYKLEKNENETKIEDFFTEKKNLNKKITKKME